MGIMASRSAVLCAYLAINGGICLAAPSLVYTEDYRFANPEPGRDGIGSSIDLRGNLLLVGSSREGTFNGAAYLFDIEQRAFLERFEPVDAPVNAEFGNSVALAGGAAVLGSRRVGFSDGDGWYGACEVIPIESPSPPFRLSADGGETVAGFGVQVASTDDRLYVCASGDDSTGVDSGAVYVFDLPSFDFSHRITLPDRPGEGLGGLIAASGNRIAVVAVGASRPWDGGAIYIFQGDSGALIGELPLDEVTDAGRFHLRDLAMSESHIVGGVDGLFDDQARFRSSALVFDAASLELVEQFSPEYLAQGWTEPAVAVTEEAVLLGTIAEVQGDVRRCVLVYSLETGWPVATLIPFNETGAFAFHIAVEGRRVVTAGRTRSPSSSVHIFTLPEFIEGCTGADLNTPYGQLDLADLVTFVTGFMNEDPIADCNGNGFFDLFDIQAFVTSFNAGCP